MASDEKWQEALEPLRSSFEVLVGELNEIIETKQDNETRWSWVNSSIVSIAGIGMGVLTIAAISAASRLTASILAGITALVSAASSLVPWDRKRRGNKVLAAKAVDIKERAQDALEGHCRASPECPTPYDLLGKLRFEKNVVCATSSLDAAVRPFREILKESGA